MEASGYLINAIVTGNSGEFFAKFLLAVDPSHYQLNWIGRAVALLYALRPRLDDCCDKVDYALC